MQSRPIEETGRLNDVLTIYHRARNFLATHTNYFKTIHRLTDDSSPLLYSPLAQDYHLLVAPRMKKEYKTAICSTPLIERNPNLVFQLQLLVPTSLKPDKCIRRVMLVTITTAALVPHTRSKREVVRRYHTILSRLKYLASY